MNSKRSKVHLVHLSSGPGGIEVLLPGIIGQMKEIDFSALVIRPRDEICVYDNAPVKIQYGSNSNVLAVIRVFRYGFKNRKDIFHVFNIGPLFLLALKLAGVRNLVYSIHGTIYWKQQYKRPLLLSLWKLAISGHFVFTANSAYSRSVFIDKIKPGLPVKLIYNPIDPARFTVKSSTEHRDPLRIIYTGRLNPGKNLPLWIDLAISIHQKMPATRFDIFGIGPLEASLNERIAAAGAGDYIKLQGFRKDIEKVYQEADLLLFLTEFESFGNVVVESILCGTPVLASPIPAMTEILGNHRIFLLNDSPDKWSEEICQKLAAIDQMKAEALKAKISFTHRFSMEQHIDSIAEIYDGFSK